MIKYLVVGALTTACALAGSLVGEWRAQYGTYPTEIGPSYFSNGARGYYLPVPLTFRVYEPEKFYDDKGFYPESK